MTFFSDIRISPVDKWLLESEQLVLVRHSMWYIEKCSLDKRLEYYCCEYPLENPGSNHMAPNRRPDQNLCVLSKYLRFIKITAIYQNLCVLGRAKIISCLSSEIFDEIRAGGRIFFYFLYTVYVGCVSNPATRCVTVGVAVPGSCQLTNISQWMYRR